MNNKKNEIAAARMTAAHKLTADTLTAYYAETGIKANYRATLSESMKLVWRIMPSIPATTAAETVEAETATARDEWNALDGDAKNDALNATVWSIRNHRDRAGTDKRGEDRPQYFQWILTKDDAQTVAAQAWLNMEKELSRAERRDAEEDTETPLSIVMWRAVMNAARQIVLTERKNPCAAEQKTDEDGNPFFDIINGGKLYTLDLEADPRGDAVAPSPEAYTATRDALFSTCRDDADRIILAAKAYGLNQTESARLVSMSQRAVSKRLENIETRYNADRYAENAAPTTDTLNARIAYHPTTRPAPVVNWLTHDEAEAKRAAYAAEHEATVAAAAAQNDRRNARRTLSRRRRRTA